MLAASDHNQPHPHHQLASSCSTPSKAGLQQQQEHEPNLIRAADKCEQPLSPSLSESFSFNSYQDLQLFGFAHNNCLKPTTLSTFSASDVKRSLIRAAAYSSANNHKPAANDLDNSQIAYSSSSSNSERKFRAHLRQHSIGRFSELATATVLHLATSEEPQQNEEPTRQESEQASPKGQEHCIAAPSPVRGRKELRRGGKQQHQQPVQLAPLATSASQHPEKQANEMSAQATIQSIQSLSLQLNRAATLQSADILASQSPINGATLDASSPGSCQAINYEQKATASNKLGRLVGKKASRVKELLLQNLGKAEKTTDELFKVYEENFYKQQAQALKLQKEFKAYMNAFKGTQEAGKSLNICIQQSTNDYQSARHDLVCENLSQMEHLSEDLVDKLRCQVMVNINEYLSQFDELKEKMAKRKRKLIDYDSSRRIYELMLANVSKKRVQLQRSQHQQQNGQQSSRSFRSAFMSNESESGIQSATSQLVDEARLLKLREQFNYCKIMYETINGELHEELPMVYEKKMKHLLMTLQIYFSLEAQFHSNAGKLFATASDVIDELPTTRSIQQQQQLDLHNHHHRIHSQHSHQHHLQHLSELHHTDEEESAHAVGFSDGKTMIGGGSSSGMGSSRGGDSSLESSSSPEASSGKGSPTGDDEVRQQEIENAEDQEEAVSAAGIAIDDDQAMDAAAVTAVAEQKEAPAGKEIAQAVEKLAAQQVDCGISGAKQDDSSPACVESEAKSKSDKLAVADEEKAAPEASIKQAAAAVVAQLKNCSESRKEVGREPVGPEVKPETTTTAIAPSTSATNEIAPVVTSQACLYKVKTSYKYLAEDVDELCFEADEIIQVVEFDDNHEQEDGWLMGIRDVNGQKGLFPANFTVPI